MTKIIIVDTNNNAIEAKEKTKITDKDIYRVSGLQIQNKNGEYLLVQRAFDKKNDPGLWMPVAVAGTLEEGETYQSNIIKETAEEIGIDLTKFDFKMIKHVRIREGHNFFLQVFSIVADIKSDDLKLDPTEIANIKWFDKETIKYMMHKEADMLVPEFAEVMRDLL